MPGLWSPPESDNSDKPSLWNGLEQEDARQRNGNGNSLLCPGSPPTLRPPGSPPALRRVSSATVNFEDLSLGPSVVVPPERLRKPTDAHETAAALEMAKHRLTAVGDGASTPETHPAPTTTDSFAFAFDIDGVLIRGGEPIPEAIEAMKVLNGQNEYGIKM